MFRSFVRHAMTMASCCRRGPNVNRNRVTTAWHDHVAGLRNNEPYIHGVCRTAGLYRRLRSAVLHCTLQNLLWKLSDFLQIACSQHLEAWSKEAAVRFATTQVGSACLHCKHAGMGNS